MPNKIAKLYDGLTEAGVYSAEISAPRNEATFYFAAAVADGDVVMLDLADSTYGLGGSAKKTTATDNLALVVGIADEAVAAGSYGRVVTYGVKLGVPTHAAALAAGIGIVTGGTAGTIKALVAHEQNKIGYSLTARTGTNIIDVFVQLR